LGDAINTAARLMGRAVNNQIYMTEAVHERVSRHFDCEALEPLALKGKSAPMAVFALKGVPDLTPQL
jgi:class 3 adenylate cyclase